MFRYGLSTSNSADVSCKLCMVLSELFLSFGKQTSFTSRQKGFRQNCTQFTARISLDKKTRVEQYIPLFALFYTIKAPNGKLRILGDFFQPPYIQNRKDPPRISFSEPVRSVYKVSYPCR